MIRMMLLLALVVGVLSATGCVQSANSSFGLGPYGKVILEVTPTTDSIRIANHGPGLVQVAVKDRHLRVHEAITLEPNTVREHDTTRISRIEITNHTGQESSVRFVVFGRDGLGFRLDLSHAAPTSSLDQARAGTFGMDGLASAD